MAEHISNPLFQAAAVWKELTEYCYVITYGYKKQLHTLHLTFSSEDFPHLARFQYLKDIALPRYNPRKIIDVILKRKITYEQIQKGIQFDAFVKPRLEALTQLKNALETNFTLFSYMPQMYPFTTRIRADYLIASHLNQTCFVFILQADFNKISDCDYLCCSAFTKGSRDYEINQRSRTILKKERIHIDTQAITILYDRLSTIS